MKYDQLEVSCFPGREELGKKAATDASNKIKQLLQTRDCINIIFAAAPSQNEFLNELRADDTIEWKRINAFHMDEYLGLPAEASQGFGNFLRRSLFNHIPLRSVEYINGNADNIADECLRYSQLLADNPPDIVCMGIGENTHIAFNEPGQADFGDADKVKVVALDEVCRQQQVNDGCFSMIDEVPEKALTLTVPVLLSAAYLFCMVPGEKKADAVWKTVTMPVSENYPSTILRQHRDARLYIDKQSAALLPGLS